MLLGKESQIATLNAEGGEQDEARSDNDGLSGGEDVVENSNLAIHGEESNDSLDDDEDGADELDEINYQQQKEVELEEGYRARKLCLRMMQMVTVAKIAMVMNMIHMMMVKTTMTTTT